MADLAVWQRTIVDEKGNIIPGAEVSVRSYPGGSLITLYEGPDGTRVKGNPFSTGADGFARFWAESQRAEIVAHGAGSTIRWVVDLLNADEVIGDAVSAATAAAAAAVGEAKAEADRAEAARDAAQLNARIYPTTADGLAATSDGDYFSVPSEDDDGYLDLYRNDNGVGIRLRTYPSSGVMETWYSNVRDTLTKTLVDAFTAEGAIWALVDRNNEVVAAVTADGSLLLPGMEQSVQGAVVSVQVDVDDVKQNISRQLYPADHLFTFIDRNREVVGYIDADGGLYLPGVEGSVQEALQGGGTIVEPELDVDLAATRHPRETFSTSALNILSSRNASMPYAAYAPIPFGYQPQNYSVSDDWIDQLSITLTPKIPLDTPYGYDTRVVHPHVIEFWGGFRGYRYWMCINPYDQWRDENPVLYGSNDLETFDLLEGFPQPLQEPPPGPHDYLSDSAFSYNPKTGEMICMWRQTLRPTQGAADEEQIVSLHYKTTRDGVNWSDSRQMHPETTMAEKRLYSPSLLYDPSTDLWHLYTCGRGWSIEHHTGPSPEGPWSTPRILTIPSGISPFHAEVRFVGDKQVMLIYGKDHDNFHFGISSNFIDWQISQTPIVTGVYPGAYKASFLPSFNAAGQMRMDVLWTTDEKGADPSEQFRLRHGVTNYVDVLI